MTGQSNRRDNDAACDDAEAKGAEQRSREEPGDQPAATDDRSHLAEVASHVGDIRPTPAATARLGLLLVLPTTPASAHGRAAASAEGGAVRLIIAAACADHA